MQFTYFWDHKIIKQEKKIESIEEHIILKDGHLLQQRCGQKNQKI